MAWIVALAALIIPVILANWVRHHSEARLLLLAVGLALGGYGSFALVNALKMQRALDSGYTIALPADPPGKQAVTIRPIPYEAMEVSLRRKDGGRLSGLFSTREAALVYKWEPNGLKFVGRYSEYDDGSAISLYVFDGTDVAPFTLEYETRPETAPALREVELRVEHSAPSRHMLRDHGIAILLPVGIFFSALGMLWITVATWTILKARRQQGSVENSPVQAR